MMRNQEAPKIVNASVWTAAIVGVLAFAVSLTTYFFGFLDNQISADTSGQCNTGETQVAINNYPDPASLIDQTHSSYYIDSSRDTYFRCSHVCISSDTSKTVGQRLSNLVGGTINGQLIQTFNNSEEFNQAIQKGGQDKVAAMTRGIIISQTKISCTGMPNSVSYGQIETANSDEITQNPRGDESSQPELDKEGIAIAKPDTTGAETAAGTPEPFGAPAGSAGTGTEEGGSDTTNAKLQKCMKSIGVYIEKWTAKSLMDPGKITHEYIRRAYVTLKKTADKNPEKTLEACQILAKHIPSSTNSGSSKKSSADNQKESTNTNADITLKVGLKYGGRDGVDADTWVAIYPSKNGFFDGTKPVPKPISDPILTYKYKKGASNPLTLNVVTKTPLPDKLAIYAVTTGGFWSSERWGAQIIDFKSQDITVDMDKKTGQKMTQGEYSIYYISYKYLEDTRN